MYKVRSRRPPKALQAEAVMCPPLSCCCCGLRKGVLVVTHVFMAAAVWSMCNCVFREIPAVQHKCDMLAARGAGPRPVAVADTDPAKWFDEAHDTELPFVCEASKANGTVSYYTLHENELGWGAADRTCESAAAGGHLATIRDHAENVAVMKACGGHACWIGMFETQNSETFGWVDNATVTYENWAKGQPNNAGRRDQDAVFIKSQAGYHIRPVDVGVVCGGLVTTLWMQSITSLMMCVAMVGGIRAVRMFNGKKLTVYWRAYASLSVISAFLAMFTIVHMSAFAGRLGGVLGVLLVIAYAIYLPFVVWYVVAVRSLAMQFLSGAVAVGTSDDLAPIRATVVSTTVVSAAPVEDSETAEMNPSVSFEMATVVS